MTKGEFKKTSDATAYFFKVLIQITLISLYVNNSFECTVLFQLKVVCTLYTHGVHNLLQLSKSWGGTSNQGFFSKIKSKNITILNISCIPHIAYICGNSKSRLRIDIFSGTHCMFRSIRLSRCHIVFTFLESSNMVTIDIFIN